jgi:hypothetical protein
MVLAECNHCGMRHDGCGGRAGTAEVITEIEGASSRPVRKIVVIDDWFAKSQT